MAPFPRIIGLAAAGALIAFTAVRTPAHEARLWREEQVDIAENR